MLGKSKNGTKIKAKMILPIYSHSTAMKAINTARIDTTINV